MRPRLPLTINCKFAVDFFARGLHTRTAVARLPLRQLAFLVCQRTQMSLTLTLTPIGNVTNIALDAWILEQYYANVRTGGYNKGDVSTISHTWIRSQLHRIRSGPTKRWLVRVAGVCNTGRHTDTSKNWFFCQLLLVMQRNLQSSKLLSFCQLSNVTKQLSDLRNKFYYWRITRSTVNVN